MKWVEINDHIDGMSDDIKSDFRFLFCRGLFTKKKVHPKTLLY